MNRKHNKWMRFAPHFAYGLFSAVGLDSVDFHVGGHVSLLEHVKLHVASALKSYSSQCLQIVCLCYVCLAVGLAAGAGLIAIRVGVSKGAQTYRSCVCAETVRRSR